MLPLITVAIDDQRALAALDRVGTLQAGAPVLMRQITGILQTEVEDNFEAQGRPRWAPLRLSSLLSKYRRDLTTSRGNARRDGGARFREAIRGNKILQGRGRLAASITGQSSATQAIVGTNVIYGRIHQLGGKTRPHVIRARRKKALAFGGILRKMVNHPGSKITARPFLALGPTGGTKIETTATQYLRTLITPR
jgi:phage virion morphogenesis protein